MINEIIQGDIREIAKQLETGSVNCIVTSPPYWGLRDYGVAGQIGLEPTPEEYVAGMVSVFRELRRVLRDDGTLWLNLGDTYAANRGYQVPDSKHCDVGNSQGMKAATIGLKPKDLIGIPWRVALALQADGWYLRSDIIWSKPNCMPESVTDRPTKAHEYIFLFAKSEQYYYDAEAIREDLAESTIADKRNGTGRHTQGKAYSKYFDNSSPDTATPDLPSWYRAKTFVNPASGRNRRSVWTIITQSYKGAHFAVFPPNLVEPCILAGCPPGGVVLDPFFGSGTTGQVCVETGRNWLGVELNPKYIKLAKKRIAGAQPPLIVVGNTPPSNKGMKPTCYQSDFQLPLAGGGDL